ncbi:MAG: Fe-S cluster assembly protein SufD [Bacteroidota bacterium]|nr:Fe-S cluster assembly protein SufD [Bacteroidota bacterium]
MTETYVTDIDIMTADTELVKREIAKSYLDTNGLPNPADEDWRFASFGTLTNNVNEAKPYYAVATEALPNSITLEIVDGAIKNIPADLPSGLNIIDWKDNSGKALINEYFAEIEKADANGIVAWNTSTFDQGIIIHVASSADIQQVIHLQFSGDYQLQKHFRILTIVESFAKATILEEYLGLSGTHTVVHEIDVKENASLELNKIQNQELGSHQFHHTHIKTAVSSFAHHTAICIGKGNIRNELKYTLAAPNNHVKLNGVYIADAKQVIANYTTVDHAMPHCLSDELYKGLATDEATAIFNGKIMVRLDAQKTNAFQSNKNLLLSRNAHIYTKPQLEIFADDVKCSHGATIGQLDQEAIFYMQARGLSKLDAISLLTAAFFNDIVEGIVNQGVRQLAQSGIRKKLERIKAS